MFEDTRPFDEMGREAQQTIKDPNLFRRFKAMLAGWLAAPMMALFTRDQGEAVAGAARNVMLIIAAAGGIALRGRQEFGVIDAALCTGLVGFMLMRQTLQSLLVWERERKGLFVYSKSPGRLPGWMRPFGGPRPSYAKSFATLSLLPLASGLALAEKFPLTGLFLAGVGVTGMVSAFLLWSVMRDTILERRDAMLVNEILEQISAEGTSAAAASPTLRGVTEDATEGRDNRTLAALYGSQPRRIRSGRPATRPETPPQARPEQAGEQTTAPSYSQPHHETATLKK
jgi:hypothetical protein